MKLVLKKLILWLLLIYQRLISPLFPPSCRFHPTCSSYAQDAFTRYGLARATYMTIRRIARCHPWHPGGYDPLP